MQNNEIYVNDRRRRSIVIDIAASGNIRRSDLSPFFFQANELRERDIAGRPLFQGGIVDIFQPK
ncbi:hypothetical protein [Musicola paradisiaca]|uniref:hypothetical protein n=1 Tax=Musicola paradisiaca TaxID=69223 RepID=UPI00031E9300|nr:hypothetical protein [Musicola paradisiaca]